MRIGEWDRTKGGLPCWPASTDAVIAKENKGYISKIYEAMGNLPNHPNQRWSKGYVVNDREIKASGWKM